MNNQQFKLKSTKLLSSLGLVVLAALIFTPVNAQTLATKVASSNQQSTVTPKNGQKKENVASMFGEPKQKIAAVGEPPISKWVYQDFTVYFENDTVLHAVLHSS